MKVLEGGVAFEVEFDFLRAAAVTANKMRESDLKPSRIVDSGGKWEGLSYSRACNCSALHGEEISTWRTMRLISDLDTSVAAFELLPVARYS